MRLPGCIRLSCQRLQDHTRLGDSFFISPSVTTPPNSSTFSFGVSPRQKSGKQETPSVKPANNSTQPPSNDNKRQATTTFGWDSASLGAENLAALLHGIGEKVEDGKGILPPNARIRDANTVLETRLALLGDLLVACRCGLDGPAGNPHQATHLRQCCSRS